MCGGGGQRGCAVYAKPNYIKTQPALRARERWGYNARAQPRVTTYVFGPPPGLFPPYAYAPVPHACTTCPALRSTSRPTTRPHLLSAAAEHKVGAGALVDVPGRQQAQHAVSGAHLQEVAEVADLQRQRHNKGAGRGGEAWGDWGRGEGEWRWRKLHLCCKARPESHLLLPFHRSLLLTHLVAQVGVRQHHTLGVTCTTYDVHVCICVLQSTKGSSHAQRQQMECAYAMCVYVCVCVCVCVRARVCAVCFSAAW